MKHIKNNPKNQRQNKLAALLPLILWKTPQTFSEKAAGFLKAPQEDLGSNNRNICSGKPTPEWITTQGEEIKHSLYLWEAQNVRPNSLAQLDRAPGGNTCNACWQDELYVGLQGN